MPDTVPIAAETVLEVVSPDGARRFVRVTSAVPDWRGSEPAITCNFSDRRISRKLRRDRVEANKITSRIGGSAAPLSERREGGSRELARRRHHHVRHRRFLRIIYRSAAPVGEDSFRTC